MNKSTGVDVVTGSTLSIMVDDDTPVIGTADIETVIESTNNTPASNAFVARPAATGSRC